MLHAYSPKLATVTPTGGQRGTTVELKLTGQHLQDVQEIVFYNSGLTVAKLESGKTNSLKATIKISSEASLGEHTLRLRGATGVSELRTFWVGPFPVSAEIGRASCRERV